MDSDTRAGSPFWRFSLRIYGQPGVPDACLALQDGCGVDVNILLYLLWLAAARRQVSREVTGEICAKSSPWRDDVVVPLRAIRRRLKTGMAPIERGAAERFRTAIKATELEAERLQQEALFALTDGLTTQTAPTVEAAARANLSGYEHVLGCELTPAAVATLLGAITAADTPLR